MRSNGAKKGDSIWTKKFLGYGYEIHGKMMNRYWKKRTCRRKGKSGKDVQDENDK